MDVLHRSCAGLDVHKNSVVACVRKMKGRKILREVRTYGTTTAELLELGDWLVEEGCAQVVMEATGVYWKPVWHLLEGRVEQVLANAQEVRNVPGRKSDFNDATWLADLIAHGLVRASFVPPQPIGDLRELTRTRKQLSREVASHIQRIQKVLETCNIKLASVVKKFLGASTRAILGAICDGETDPEKLAELAKGTLRAKRGALTKALHGRVREHHRILIRSHLRVIDSLRDEIEALEARMEEVLLPFEDAVTRLQTIPGIGPTAAQTIIAEIGLDMTRFRTAGHLRSWAGLCPRMDESAGKKRSRKIRRGNPWLKTMLVQCAWSAIKKQGYLKALYQNVKRRRGSKRAIVAVAAAMLTAIHGMIRDGSTYRDLGDDHFSNRDKKIIAASLARRLRGLGYEVEMRQVA